MQVFIFPLLKCYYLDMANYFYKRVIEEVELINQLRQVFAVAFDEDSVWNSNTPSEEYLKRVLSDNNYIALVAIGEQGQVVGGLVAYVLQKIDQERSEIYLYDLAVASEHRRRGIATKLITELKDLAKTYGTYTIFVQADNEDFEAMALYSKLSSSIETKITHFDIAVP